MQNDLKRLHLLKKINIAYTVLSVLSVVFLIIGIVLIVVGTTTNFYYDYYPYYSGDYYDPTSSMLGYVIPGGIMLALSIGMSIAVFVLYIIVAIKILNTWQSQEINEIKLLWGLLQLLLLSWIASWIFYCKAKKILSSSPRTSSTLETSTTTTPTTTSSTPQTY